MAMIIAFKDNDKIYLASNSSYYYSGSFVSASNSNNNLIWKDKDSNLILGNHGFRRDLNIIKTTKLIDDDFKGLLYKYLNQVISKNIFDAIVQGMLLILYDLFQLLLLNDQTLKNDVIFLLFVQALINSSLHLYHQLLMHLH